jgi:A/G-specific adenine glycosylase
MAVESAPSITNRILAHYDANARQLPWRSSPGAPPPDPYAVWLSEIMLQQTTVVAVKPYFQTFLSKWPTVKALAAADDSDVMSAWAGLGYYARARNLLACARAVAQDYQGRFPKTAMDLRGLPGIGPYTAAAIASIAFGERVAVVDGNVERVITRLYALADPLQQIKGDIARRVDALTPASRPGDFAQAMMDLGATLCSPRNPACALCPVMPHCAGKGDPLRYPVKLPKVAKPERTGVAWWIERDGKVLLVRRPAKGLLGGMLALPSEGWEKAGRIVDFNGPIVGVVRHVFTHFALNLQLIRASDLPDHLTESEGKWWPIDRLDEAGLPSLFAKAAKLALERENTL